jgi:Flp pilus assembly protein TadD
VTAALVLLLSSGCASVDLGSSEAQPATAAASAAPTAAPAPAVAAAPVTPPSAATPAAGAAPAPTAAAAPDTAAEAPVSAATQRAFDEARRALRAGRTDDAERAFRALTQSNPELAGPHANLGVIYREAGKLDQSIAELERASKVSPRQPVVWNQLGISYRHAGQFAKARQAYERAIELDSGYAAAVLNLAILHDLYLADGPKALDLYQRYAALAPTESAAVNKWIADLRNRKPASSGSAQAVAARKEAQ